MKLPAQVNWTHEEYNADREYLRCSTFADFCYDPMLYYYRHVVAQGPARPASKEMVFGRLFHSFVLEGEVLWLVPGQCETTTKAGTQCSKAGVEFIEGMGWVCTQHGGIAPEDAPYLSQGDVDQLHGMQESVLSNPSAVELLERGFEEHCFLWEHPQTGIKCKCLIDRMQFDGRKADLKTIKDARESTLRARMYGDPDEGDICYALQAAWYTEGQEAVLPDVREEFYFIFASKEWPYRTTVWAPPSDVVPAMRKYINRKMRELKACMDEHKALVEAGLDPRPAWQHPLSRQVTMAAPTFHFQTKFMSTEFV